MLSNSSNPDFQNGKKPSWKLGLQHLMNIRICVFYKGVWYSGILITFFNVLKDTGFVYYILHLIKGVDNKWKIKTK